MQIGMNLNQFQGSQAFGNVNAGQGVQHSAAGQQTSPQNDFKALGLDPTTASNGFQQAQKFFGGANLQ